MKGRKGEWEGEEKEEKGGLCRNLPGAGSQAAAWAVAGAAGPSAQRSQFRSGKPDEAGRIGRAHV